MGSNKLDPSDPRSILHLHHQSVLVPSNVEHHPVIGTNTCAVVLILYVLRSSPACLDRLVVPALQGSVQQLSVPKVIMSSVAEFLERRFRAALLTLALMMGLTGKVENRLQQNIPIRFLIPNPAATRHF
jgi:hypothetical protein